MSWAVERTVGDLVLQLRSRLPVGGAWVDPVVPPWLDDVPDVMPFATEVDADAMIALIAGDVGVSDPTMVSIEV